MGLIPNTGVSVASPESKKSGKLIKKLINNPHQCLNDSIMTTTDNRRHLILFRDAGRQRVPDQADPRLLHFLQLIQHFRQQLVVILVLEVVGLDQHAGILQLERITVGAFS